MNFFAFNKAYPKVNLQIVRMTTAEVLQRAVAESQAHKPVASLYIISGTQPQQMEQDNMLAKYTSPQSQGFSSGPLANRTPAADSAATRASRSSHSK